MSKSTITVDRATFLKLGTDLAEMRKLVNELCAADSVPTDCKIIQLFKAPGVYNRPKKRGAVRKSD